MAVFSIAALQSELQNDPSAQGYATINSQQGRNGLVARLNLVQAGITVKRTDVMANEIVEAIASTDFAASPNPAHVMLVQVSLQQRSPLRFQDDAGNDTPVLANIKRLLTAGSASRTALNAIATRTGSRAEFLWGAGIIITDQNVADAGF